MGCSSSTSIPSSAGDHLHSLLASSPFFLVLEPPDLRRFSALFQSRKCAAGEKVFTQGETGSELFVVGEGECDITCVGTPGPSHGGPNSPAPAKNKAAQMLSGSGVVGGANFLCSKKSGDFFGERAVLAEEDQPSLRTATVTATVPSELLVLSRASFHGFVRSLDPASQGRLSTVLGTRMIDSLRQIDFLHSLDDMRLGLLANVFRYVTLQAGEVVFEEGDLGRELYIISTGQCSVSARSGDTAATAAATSADVRLHPDSSSSRGSVFATASSPPIASTDVQFATLKEGQYFGEVALMIETPRTATVRATSRCLLLVLSSVDFQNFLALTPGLRDKFTALASSRIAQQFRKWKVPFFESIPEHRFQALSDLCRMDAYDQGTVIFREGDETSADQPAFYLLVSGSVTATKADVGLVATLLPPQYFGEVALVTDSPRSATITCLTRCVLLSLTRSAFETFFLAGDDESGAGGEQYAEFSIKLSQRQVPLTPVLQHTLGHRLFAQHLRTEFSSENLEFYDDSKAFEQIDPSVGDGAALQLSTAGELVSRYISSDAATQINIPASVRESCLSEFRCGRLTKSMFAPARLEIFKLMASDSFQRFKANALFQQLLDAVGTYGSAPVMPNYHRHAAPTTGQVVTINIAPTTDSEGSAQGPRTPLQPQQPLWPDSRQLVKARHSVKIHSRSGSMQPQETL